tara:strand:- start:51 stop:611 length:561 start_codon:yes stop_codon:yes gene_type:complete
MRQINEVIIHATATRPDWWKGKRTSDKVAEVRRWHMEDRKWSDIGYHYLIDRDGTVARGRPIGRTGAHVQGHNTGSIGISLFGGHGGAATDKFSQHFTVDQEVSLRELLVKLSAQYDIKKVSGHNQYANKGCPCFNVSEWMARTEHRSPKTQPNYLGGRTTPKPEPHAAWLGRMQALRGVLFGGKT